MFKSLCFVILFIDALRINQNKGMLFMRIGYCRVSTTEQNTARQEVLMERLGVDKIFIDKCSGKNTDRPALKEMLDFIRADDIVIVESISRLCRNVRDLLEIVDNFRKLGVVFISQKIGSKTPKNEPKFWTLEEYLTFIETIKLNPIFYYAFQVLFWCGLRLGELLALTLDDIDFENATLSIKRSYQKINGEPYISDTKTVNGIRKVYLPQRLVDELHDYTNGLYIKDNKTRIFPISKSNIHNVMHKSCEECGVKRIPIHGLRHSHISLLADMGITEAVIASRVGHKRQGITSHYTHPYEKSEKEVAFKLNELMEAM